MITLTEKELAFAHGYYSAFILEGCAENVDTDYDNWFSYGEADFHLHLVDGFVAVDAYKVSDKEKQARVMVRVLWEKYDDLEKVRA